MIPLNPLALDVCVERLPKFVIDTLEYYGGKVIVAGGFLRSVIAGEPVKDIDLFVDNQITAENIVVDFTREGGRSVTRTANAITLRFSGDGVTATKHEPPIQIITRWTYTKPEDVIASFDFTIAQAGLWFDGEWKGVCSKTFMVDLSLKQLVYTSPLRNEDCAGSLCRVLKFVKRGYNIDTKNMSAVITRLVSKSCKIHLVNPLECDDSQIEEAVHREIAKANGRRY
jgi:hypothetical protein